MLVWVDLASHQWLHVVWIGLRDASSSRIVLCGFEGQCVYDEVFDVNVELCLRALRDELQLSPDQGIKLVKRVLSL